MVVKHRVGPDYLVVNINEKFVQETLGFQMFI